MSTEGGNDFALFQQELEEALLVVASSEVRRVSAKPVIKDHKTSEFDLIDAQSLLDRCVHICEEYKPEPRVIRSIHHFACTGGSLISKCLHAMPGVRLISEVHPLARLHMNINQQRFTPTDTITAGYYADLPDFDQLSLRIFEEDIKLILDQAEKKGFYPIFREHSHTDYCVGPDAIAAKPLSYGSLFNIPQKRIATVRNPLDSYSSLTHNNWLHHEPKTFDEYCKRYLMFLEAFDEESIFYYEDFVMHPEREMRKICEALDVPYHDMFRQIFDFRSISGDSGRSSSVIEKRSARDRPHNLIADLESKHVEMLMGKLNY